MILRSDFDEPAASGWTRFTHEDNPIRHFGRHTSASSVFGCTLPKKASLIFHDVCVEDIELTRAGRCNRREMGSAVAELNEVCQ